MRQKLIIIWAILRSKGHFVVTRRDNEPLWFWTTGMKVGHAEDTIKHIRELCQDTWEQESFMDFVKDTLKNKP